MQNPIKQDEVVKRLLAGTVGFLGEYRHSKAENLQWRDKTSGKSMHAPVLRHTVETSEATISITERVPDDFDVVGFKSPYSKGQKVLVTLTELKLDKGNLSGRGSLTPVVS